MRREPRNGADGQGAPALALPRKLFEGWFSVFEGERHVGHDRLYWEPHGDGTAWFEREARFRMGGFEVDRKVKARFRLGPRPTLTWCRATDGDERAEYALPSERASAGASVHPLRAQEGLLPSSILAVAAAAAKTEPGPVAEVAVLEEWSGEASHGRSLVCDGPSEVAGPEKKMLAAVRYRLVDKAGTTLETYWVDQGKRLRRIDMGGPVAVLTTRAAATAEVGSAG